jgi:hypothetical protein
LQVIANDLFNQIESMFVLKKIKGSVIWFNSSPVF